MGQNTEEKGVSEVKVKLVVVGDCGCGKTTLIKRYVNGSYTDVSKRIHSFVKNTCSDRKYFAERERERNSTFLMPGFIFSCGRG